MCGPIAHKKRKEWVLAKVQRREAVPYMAGLRSPESSDIQRKRCTPSWLRRALFAPSRLCENLMLAQALNRPVTADQRQQSLHVGPMVEPGQRAPQRQEQRLAAPAGTRLERPG